MSNDLNGWQPFRTAPLDGRPILTCNEFYTENGFLPIVVRNRTYHPNSPGAVAFRDHNGHRINFDYWRELPLSPTGKPAL